MMRPLSCFAPLRATALRPSAACWLRPPPAGSSAAYTTEPAGLDGVIITRSALDRLHAIKTGAVPATMLPAAVQDPAQVKLRVAIDSGGCSGFQYQYELTDGAPEEDDIVFEKDGHGVIVDASSLEFVRGATVDFEQDMMRSGFQVINNPNSEAGCGCGVSFSPKD